MEKFIQNYFMYFAFGTMVIFYIFWKIIPFLKKARSAVKMFTCEIHLNSRSNVSEEQYKKIAISAIYSQQQGAYVNTITTGLESSKTLKILSQWWGINDTNQALDKLDYLSEKGFRYYFNTVLKAFEVNDTDEQKNIILNDMGDNEEDVQKAYQQLIHLQQTWKELVDNNVVTNHKELMKYNNIGWDCGRLVFLSRLCLDAGYISENEVWQYTDKAYKLVIQNFDNWSAFSKSYIIGRGMWGGIDSDNEGIMSIAEDLLSKEKSPWVALSLK
ncbi:DUF1266 domain-containing protein [Aquimarina sp. M1]